MKLLNFAFVAASMLLPIAAEATDLPSKKAPSAPVAGNTAFGWDGFYVGANLGVGRFKTDQIDSTSPPAPIEPYSASGFMGGGQIGYDRQFEKYVLGIQAMIDLSDIEGSSTYPEYIVGGLTSKINSSRTVTLRAGYLIQPQLLAYVKGGMAWADVDYGDYDPEVIDGEIDYAYVATASKSRTGWTVGFGLEYAVAKNWSAFVEYDHANFGSKSVTLDYTYTLIPDGYQYSYTYKHTTDELLFGVNYRY